MKTIGSYFNPCSGQHNALQNFKGLSCLKQAGIGFVVTCLALSLLFALFAVPVFRLLNERCQLKTKLNETDEQTRNVYNAKILDLGSDTEEGPLDLSKQSRDYFVKDPTTTTLTSTNLPATGVKPNVAPPTSNPGQPVQTSSSTVTSTNLLTTPAKPNVAPPTSNPGQPVQTSSSTVTSTNLLTTPAKPNVASPTSNPGQPVQTSSSTVTSTNLLTTPAKPNVAPPTSNPVQPVQTSSTALSAPKDPEPAQPQKTIILGAEYRFKKGAIIRSFEKNNSFLSEDAIKQIDDDLSSRLTFGSTIHHKITTALYNCEKAMQEKFEPDPTTVWHELYQTTRIRATQAESLFTVLANCAESVVENPE